MLKKLLRLWLNSFRRIIGTQQIMNNISDMRNGQEINIQLLISLGNALKYSVTDPKTLKETTPYKRCAKIISLLSPMDVRDANYVRVGGDNDGGYIMLDDFQRRIDGAYSFGINDDVSWDEEIASKGIDIFMYDHTIEKLPKKHPRFHYFKTGVTGFKKGLNLKTLDELISENGHKDKDNLILKMDIESCEWDVFTKASFDTINLFSQIVIEFHELNQAVHQERNDIVEVLKKINQTHQCVHVHANACGIRAIWMGPLVLPDILEVTYVRRDDFKDRLIPNTRTFPTEIATPNLSKWPNLYLGHFDV